MFARSTRRQPQSPAVARCAPLHIWRVNATSVPRQQGIIHREIVNKWRQGCFLPLFGCILLFCFFGCRHTQVCAAAQQEQREQQRDTAVIPSLGNRGHCLRGGRGGRHRCRLRGGRCPCTVAAGAAVAVGCSVGAGVGVAVRFAVRNFSSFPQYFKHF